MSEPNQTKTKPRKRLASASRTHKPASPAARDGIGEWSERTGTPDLPDPFAAIAANAKKEMIRVRFARVP